MSGKHSPKIDFENILRLAKLKVSDDKKKQLKSDINEIVEFVGKLAEINTDNGKPDAHIVPGPNVFREDIPVSMFERDELLKNAPSKTNEYILVPRIIE